MIGLDRGRPVSRCIASPQAWQTSSTRKLCTMACLPAHGIAGPSWLKLLAKNSGCAATATIRMAADAKSTSAKQAAPRIVLRSVSREPQDAATTE